MILVNFTDVEEFECELRQRCPDDRILRVTNEWIPSKMTPTIRHWIVRAAYVRDGQIVRFNKYCGDDWGREFPETDKVRQRAKEIIERLTKCAQALAIDVRAGVLEDSTTPK